MPRRNRECGCCCTPTIVPVVSMTGQAENELGLPGVNDNVVRVTSGTGSAIFGPMRFRHCRLNLVLYDKPAVQDPSFRVQPSETEFRFWCDDGGEESAARLIVKVEHGDTHALPANGTFGQFPSVPTHAVSGERYIGPLGNTIATANIVELLVSFELFDRTGQSAGTFHLAANPPGLTFEISATLNDDNSADVNIGQPGASIGVLHLFDTVNTEDAEPPGGTSIQATSTQSTSCSCDITVYDQQGRESTTPCIPADSSIYCDQSSEGYVGRLSLYPWSKDDCTHWVRPSRVTHAECGTQFSSLRISFGPFLDAPFDDMVLSGDYELTSTSELGDLSDNQFWFEGLPHVTNRTHAFRGPQQITRLEMSAIIVTDQRKGLPSRNVSVCEDRTIVIGSFNYSDAIVPRLLLQLRMIWIEDVGGNNREAWLTAGTSIPFSNGFPLSFLRGDIIQTNWSDFNRIRGLGTYREVLVGTDPTVQLIP